MAATTPPGALKTRSDDWDDVLNQTAQHLFSPPALNAQWHRSAGEPDRGATVDFGLAKVTGPVVLSRVTAPGSGLAR